MYMFIANGLHQNFDFQYRLPNTKTYRTQLIPIGGQIRISGELTEADIDAIVKVHTIYGMIRADEIAQFKGFHIPYVYSINTPVSAEVIGELIVHNREYNEALGKKLRQEAAVALSNSIEDGTTDHLTNLELTIEEVSSKDRDATFAEGIRVTRDRERGAPQGPEAAPLDFNSRRRSMF